MNLYAMPQIRRVFRRLFHSTLDTITGTDCGYFAVCYSNYASGYNISKQQTWIQTINRILIIPPPPSDQCYFYQR